MKKCLKCNEAFPNFIVIDNKKRNLQNRKYCLVCSPFKSKNTKKLHQKNIILNKKCELCKKDNPTHKSLCAGCNTKVRRYRAKHSAVQLLGGKCNRCGWSGEIAGFQFHHLYGKEFGIGSVANKRWELILSELKKCELLCATCHSIEHSNTSEEFIDYALNKYNGRLLPLK